MSDTLSKINIEQLNLAVSNVVKLENQLEHAELPPISPPVNISYDDMVSSTNPTMSSVSQSSVIPQMSTNVSTECVVVSPSAMESSGIDGENSAGIDELSQVQRTASQLLNLLRQQNQQQQKSVMISSLSMDPQTAGTITQPVPSPQYCNSMTKSTNIVLNIPLAYPSSISLNLDAATGNSIATIPVEANSIAHTCTSVPSTLSIQPTKLVKSQQSIEISPRTIGPKAAYSTLRMLPSCVTTLNGQTPMPYIQKIPHNMCLQTVTTPVAKNITKIERPKRQQPKTKTKIKISKEIDAETVVVYNKAPSNVQILPKYISMSPNPTVFTSIPQSSTGGCSEVVATLGELTSKSLSCSSDPPTSQQLSNFTAVSHMDVISLLKDQIAPAPPSPATVAIGGGGMTREVVQGAVSPPTTALISPPPSVEPADRENQRAVAAVIALLMEPQHQQNQQQQPLTQQHLQASSASLITSAQCPESENMSAPPSVSLVVEQSVATSYNSSWAKYCLSCDKMYTESGCLQHFENYLVSPDSPVPPQARLTLPAGLHLKCDVHADTVTGVTTAIPIPRGTVFGPLLGAVTEAGQTDLHQQTGGRDKHSHQWKLFTNCDLSHILDCSDEHISNWLRYMRRAVMDSQQNIRAFQQGLQLYFVTLHDVAPDTELRYWFAADYGRMQGFLSRPEESYSCPDCAKMFTHLNQLEGHLRQFHPDPVGRNHICNICNKPFRSSTKLKQHMLVHRKVKPFSCLYCGKAFNDKSNLRKHCKVHIDVKQHCCEECGKTFRQKIHLQKHALVHQCSEAPRSTCTVCQTSYRRAYDLKVHMRKHYNNMLHCDVCNKGFDRRQNLQRHQKIHLGQKNFKCVLCRLGFTTKYHMERHANKCQGPRQPVVGIHPETGAELGLSIAKRRIHKQHEKALKKKSLPSVGLE